MPKRAVKLRRKPRKRAESSKSPTQQVGKSAKADLIGRVVLFRDPWKRVKLPYYEPALSRTGTLGAITNYFFSANAVYDPNVTGTGHQPMGFDTMMLYYEQYTVMASKITVTFVNNGKNACRAGIAITPDTTAAVTGDIVENGLIKFCYLDNPGNISDATFAQGGGERIKEMSMNCNVASYFGRKTKQEMLNDTSLSGTVAANPSEQVYFDIITWGGFNTAVNTDVFLDVVVEYDVIFWEPRKVSQQ